MLLNSAPGVLAGIPLQGDEQGLEKSGSGECNGVEVGRGLESLFCAMASPSSLAAPKVIVKSKPKHTLFPKFIVQLGLFTSLLLKGLCARPRGVGLQACFAQVFVYG